MTNDKNNSSEKKDFLYFSVLDLITDSNYRTYNIQIARYLSSVNAAIMLSELIGKCKYHGCRNQLINDSKYGFGWFYYTQEDVEERTMLSRKEQDTALKKLIHNFIVEKKSIGMPARRHFKINIDEILKMIGIESHQSSLPFSDKLDCPKGANTVVRKGQTAHIIEEPKDEHQKKNPAAIAALSADADALSSFFLQKLKERKPDIKLPLHKSTTDEFDRMIRIDGRDPKILRQMIEWIHRHEFWSTNILSAKKLRQQYDQIDLQALRSHDVKNSQNNKNFALKQQRKYPETYKHLVFQAKSAVHASSAKDLSLNLPPETFKKEFVNMFGINYDDLSPTDKL